MATAYSETNIHFTGEGIMSAPEPTFVLDSPTAIEYSGITFNQNGDTTASTPITSQWLYQTFRLPKDYPRGVGSQTFIPKLCGFQVNVDVTVGQSVAAALDWRVDYWHPQRGWLGVVNGTEVGSPGDGDNVWFDINFSPVDVTDYWWRKFRFGIAGRNPDSPVFRVPIFYDGNAVEIDDQMVNVVPDISPAPLIDGKRYIVDLDGQDPAILEVEGDVVLYSTQQGIESIWYSAPNPLAGTSGVEYVTVPSESIDTAQLEFEQIAASIPFATPDSKDNPEVITIARVVGPDLKAYDNDGVNSLQDTGREYSFRFRIMSLAPDIDRDCVGSTYRTVAIQNAPESVRTSVGDLQDAYWLSAPNPSQFACEALYFDIRDGDDAQVVDHITIDPVTPGIYMNVYFSNDPIPGIDTDTWDALLWERIDKQFLLRRKENFALPAPITAKYIKLEFTQLQPVWYAPGTFQLPTRYRKHPKWVMDYYLAYYQYVRAQDIETATAVDVTYDALDLAYNYYLDDLQQDNPNAPTTVESADGISLLTGFLQQEQSAEAAKVDPQTLIQIQLSLQPFTAQPAVLGNFGSMLQKLSSAGLSTNTTNNYSTEVTVSPTAQMSLVSSLDRDSLIIEKQFPVTSFYLTSRHFYMISEATFQQDRAYFAGIKEVMLTREHYATRYDNDLYIESAGDTLNIDTNDFDSVNHTWVTYTTGS